MAVGLAVVILAGFVRATAGWDWLGTAAEIRAANPVLLVLALLVFYAGFLARVIRWQTLLTSAHTADPTTPGVPGFPSLAGIMYRAWFVNNVTIARAGDGYRALLLRRSTGAQLSRSGGTIAAERLIDIVVLAGMLVPALAWSLHGELPRWARGALVLASVAVIGGPLVLRSIRRLGSIASARVPDRFGASILRFSEAAACSIQRLPRLIAFSALGWLGESLMVGFAARAIGIDLPWQQAATAALVTALLTSIPITPGGLGVADVGLVFVLVHVGVDRESAAAIAVLVRTISFGSVVVGGAFLWCMDSVRSRRSAPSRRAVETGSMTAMRNRGHEPISHRQLSVDVVIPVYNEEASLPRSIPALCAHLEEHCPYQWQVTVADNASTDRTTEVAAGLAAADPRVQVLRLEQKGRGRALRATWSRSEASILAYMDVDLSTNLSAFMPLIAPLASGNSEVAIGSRLLPGARVTRQPKRELLSRGYNLLIWLLFRQGFSDAQCGFKALTRASAASLLPEVENETWFFDTELLLLAEERGMRIHEVAVDWVEDLDSRVRIGATVVEDVRGLLRVRRDQTRRRWRRLALPAAAG